MGDCRNCDPFLGTLNIRCQRDHNFDNHPYIHHTDREGVYGLHGAEGMIVRAFWPGTERLEG